MHRSLLILVSLTTVAVAEPKITSQTTALYPSKQCTTKVAGGEGQDPVLKCPALKGFAIEVGFSAEETLVEISDKAGNTVDMNGIIGSKLEWRLADGKPFAVIVSIAGSDMDGGTQKPVNEQIVVFGLPGYAISGRVDAKKRDAWKLAREMADDQFKKRATVPSSRKS